MKKTRKTKSKIGIWVRIKNIYDNSPYLVGFIISPIVWYFIILLLGPLLRPLIKTFPFEFTLLLQLFTAYVLFLIPNWVGVIISKKKLEYIISIILLYIMLIFYSYFFIYKTK